MLLRFPFFVFFFVSFVVEANNTANEICVSSGLQKYVGVFALSNVIFGVGGATLYTVGTAYIDDSVDATASPLYMGKFELYFCPV